MSSAGGVMDKNWNGADANRPHEGGSPGDEREATLAEHEASSWVADFANSGPPVDPDRVWLQIAAQLDEVEAPRRPLVARAYLGVGHVFHGAARFAMINNGGWGGPLVVGLFAVLVIAAVIAARTSQGHGLS